MFGPQLATLRYSVKSIAHRTLWSAIAGVLAVIGFVFLVVGFWIAAEARFGALHTAFGAAVIFIGLALLAALWARRPPRVISRQAAHRLENPMNTPAMSTASLINALIMGIAAGRAVRRKDR